MHNGFNPERETTYRKAECQRLARSVWREGERYPLSLPYRGTGIGCYFDDVLHKTLGLTGHDWHSLYHFTVGAPV
jgi:hypothetical protein